MSSAWLLSYDGKVENDEYEGVGKLHEADIKILQHKKNLCFKSLNWMRVDQM